MKKLKIFIFMFLMLIPFTFSDVEAKTISDLRKELESIEQREKENNSEIVKTEGEINNTKASISNIYGEMETISNDITKADEDIKRLNVDIADKNDSTKKLLASLQQTTGNSFYLEYIFGADTITDFIYRYALAEQITDYNEDLINEMTSLIKENEEKKVELATKKQELSVKQADLSVQLSSLSNTKTKLYELDRSIEDEIANAKSVIQMYKNAGCKENEEINICANRLLPPDTKFYRPFESGYVTSEFGYRNAIYSNGRLISSTGIHEGIDLSNGLGKNNPVYAIANGKVVKVFYDQWGGNQVVIHHNIGGEYYTSSYAHFSKILVSEGDLVTKDTVIAMMGATGSATGYHLHLAISTGLRYKDYIWYNDYVARCVNPRNLINFPSYENTWYNRVSYYN